MCFDIGNMTVPVDIVQCTCKCFASIAVLVPLQAKRRSSLMRNLQVACILSRRVGFCGYRSCGVEPARASTAKLYSRGILRFKEILSYRHQIWYTDGACHFVIWCMVHMLCTCTMHTHRHLRLRETLSERRAIWYTDAVQRVLFNGAGFGVLWCRCTCARWGSSDFEIV